MPNASTQRSRGLGGFRAAALESQQGVAIGQYTFATISQRVHGFGTSTRTLVRDVMATRKAVDARAPFSRSGTPAG